MGFLREFLSSNASRPNLEFGINENVKLTNISNVKRINEGVAVPRNTFLTFSKYNDKGEIVAQSEVSFYDLDHTKELTKNMNNLSNQAAQLVAIITCLNPTKVNDFDFTQGLFTTEEELLKLFATKTGCDKVIDNLYKSFEELVKDFLGEKCPMLRVKFVTSNKSTYPILPGDANFIELMSSKPSLAITGYELKRKAEAETAASGPKLITPETKGEAPTVGGISLSSL